VYTEVYTCPKVKDSSKRTPSPKKRIDVRIGWWKRDKQVSDVLVEYSCTTVKSLGGTACPKRVVSPCGYDGYKVEMPT